jgi:hypothetical protein
MGEHSLAWITLWHRVARDQEELPGSPYQFAFQGKMELWPLWPP